VGTGNGTGAIPRRRRGLARLVHLGVRQARYLGRTKTRFQLLLSATVVNLTLLAYADLEAAGGPNPAVHALAVATAVVSGLLALAAGRRSRPSPDAEAIVRWRPTGCNLPTFRPDF
jgi:hypothetical protein